MNERLLILCGPTASGKSAVAMNICEGIHSPLVCCDSMQLYRRMDIGTAKPTLDEQARVKHFMFDVLEPGESCSAAKYRDLALPILQDIFSMGEQSVLCGGTGLYINALTKPLGFSVESDPALRAELEARAVDDEGKLALHKELSQIDPESAARLHPNDARRVIRAIEVYRLAGMTLTEQNRLDAIRPADYQANLYAIDWSRDVLYERIDRRVDEMIDMGLVNEVQGLLDEGLGDSGTAMQAIGYKEIACALRGEMTMNEAIDWLKRATRNYAKRQLTWFRRDERVNWIAAQDRSVQQMADEIWEDFR